MPNFLRLKIDNKRSTNTEECWINFDHVVRYTAGGMPKTTLIEFVNGETTIAHEKSPNEIAAELK